MTTATEPRVLADLDEDGKYIVVTFGYNPDFVRAVKKVPGYKWMPALKQWRFPRDTTTARILRKQFGEDLKLGPALVAWGRDAVRKEDELKSLASATDATLVQLPKVAPSLAEYLRDYQRADAAMMAAANVICANQPGLGKTVTSIASIIERGNLMKGGHLIIAPKTSLDVVWEYELEKWTSLPVIIMSGDDSPAERRELIELVMEFEEDDTAYFLVMNPAFLRWEIDKDAEPELKNGKMIKPRKPVYPEIFDIEWVTVFFDEYHKMGLSNPKTALYDAANHLKVRADGQRGLISGTPMGGKPIKLWGGLHWLYPEVFTSKWRWADQWLEVSDNGYGKVIEGIRAGLEDDFWEHLRPYLVRRTKEEVVKELPPKQRIDVWCDMTEKQRRQYEAMAANAEVKIEEENLSATGILAEYTRLKQFADAHCKATRFADGTLKVTPTHFSGKLPHVLEILEERGISADKENQEGDECVVIGSQFSQVVDMVTDYLISKGIPAEKITGDVSQAKRTELTQRFQRGEVRVMVITTTAGGVSITLDRASTMIILDETWVPDDQEQLEDRIHRVSRIHQVTVYYLRSKGTIEEHIMNVTMGKAVTNSNILDYRRMGLHA
jgi:SNF2 family DNA or RNA helicase